MPGPDRARPVLIVGGTGRVGRMLARYWSAHDLRERFVFQTRQSKDGMLTWDPGEGSAALVEWVRAVGGCHAMVVLAGATPGSDVPMTKNAEIAQACLSAARVARIPRVLYASSSAVYGMPGAAALRETDPVKPTHLYGQSKLAAERVCEEARDAGTEVCVLRIGNVAGADMLLQNAAHADMANPILLDQFEDKAGPRRSYIGICALARVIEQLVDLEQCPDLLNVGAPVPVSMESLLEASGVPWEFVPARVGAMQDFTLDCSRLCNQVRFTARDSDPFALVAEACKWGVVP